MATPHREWLYQAKRDHEVARHLLDAGYFEWSAYAAQQAAEKAVKAVRLLLGTHIDDIKQHDLRRLLGTLPDVAPHLGLAEAGELSGHNQAARYPGFRGEKDEAPCKTYDKEAAKKAVDLATQVIVFHEPLLDDLEAFWEKQRSET